MYLIENTLNATKGWGIYDGEEYPVDCGDDSVGEIYRRCAREYGRCIGKVYVDSQGGEAIHCGWVFQKRQEYSDNRPSTPRDQRTYLHETWITLYSEPPRKVWHHGQVARIA